MAEGDERIEQEEPSVIEVPISLKPVTAVQKRAMKPKPTIHATDKEVIERVTKHVSSAIEKNKIVKAVAEEDYGNIARAVIQTLVLGNVEDAIKEATLKGYKKGKKDARAEYKKVTSDEEMPKPKVEAIEKKPTKKSPAAEKPRNIKPHKLYREESEEEEQSDDGEPKPTKPPAAKSMYDDI